MQFVRVALAAFLFAAAAVFGPPLSAAEGSRPPSVDDLLDRLGYKF